MENKDTGCVVELGDESELLYCLKFKFRSIDAMDGMFFNNASPFFFTKENIKKAWITDNPSFFIGLSVLFLIIEAAYSVPGRFLGEVHHPFFAAFG